MNLPRSVVDFEARSVPLPARSIREIADTLGYTSDWNWSWDNYKSMILAMSKAYGLRHHLEIGGGAILCSTPRS